MIYSIEFKKSALKKLYKLPKNVSRKIAKEINTLAVNPRPHGYKKLKVEENLHRIRSGNYRVVYEIKDKVLLVLVVSIGDRKDIYRK